MTPASIRTIPNAICQSEGDLGRLASNLYWTWHPEAAAILRRVNPAKFDSGIGPVQILAETAGPRDPQLMADAKAAVAQMEADLSAVPAAPAGIQSEAPVAYYCAEYGLHESFAQYCGGLGILAGDHCKEASDLGLPFVAIGCFYRLGFFRQLLDSRGRQIHTFPEFDPALCAVERVLDPKTNEPLTVGIDFPGRRVSIAVWRVAVGRTPLLLLDTYLPENARADREITAQLYMVSREMRFHQEMVLGIGGTRVLEALGIAPSVYHMNEGHSALLLIERLRRAVAEGKTWKEAQAAIRSASVLTIHTPVPAGNERFDAKVVSQLLEPTLSGTGIRIADVLKLGRDSVNDPKVFDMTAFALRLSRAANGVSILHGHTADDTWRSVTGLPVGAVTNGVHMPTWVGPELRALFAKHGVGLDRGTHLELTGNVWEGVMAIPDEELWAAHQSQKARLAAFAGERLVRQHTRHGEGPTALAARATMLDPEAMVLGFARRFTGYKRAGLLLSDPKRLARMLGNPERPVQIVFSGKAHMLDEEGQELLAEVYRMSQDPRFLGKIFLLEEYDMAVGRHLVQGVDVWLNNPLRPLEASGTSGMKAAANGVPNCSILDGWWDEGFVPEPRNGWAVGSRTPRKNREAQDKFDALALFSTLEKEVLPRYWNRSKDGLSHEWMLVMKRAIATGLYRFSTRRMIEDYASRMYSA